MDQSVSIRDAAGRVVEYWDGDEYRAWRTYDDAGNELTYRNSDLVHIVYTYDDSGKELTCVNLTVKQDEE